MIILNGKELNIDERRSGGKLFRKLTCYASVFTFTEGKRTEDTPADTLFLLPVNEGYGTREYEVPKDTMYSIFKECFDSNKRCAGFFNIEGVTPYVTFIINSASYRDSVLEALRAIKNGYCGQHEQDTAAELIEFLEKGGHE